MLDAAIGRPGHGEPREENHLMVRTEDFRHLERPLLEQHPDLAMKIVCITFVQVQNSKDAVRYLSGVVTPQRNQGRILPGRTTSRGKNKSHFEEQVRLHCQGNFKKFHVSHESICLQGSSVHPACLSSSAVAPLPWFIRPTIFLLLKYANPTLTLPSVLLQKNLSTSTNLLTKPLLGSMSITMFVHKGKTPSTTGKTTSRFH